MIIIASVGLLLLTACAIIAIFGGISGKMWIKLALIWYGTLWLSTLLIPLINGIQCR